MFVMNKTDALKIKSILFSIGLNEKYVAFEYMVYVLMQLMDYPNIKSSYKAALIDATNYYNVSLRTITQAINKLLKKCNISTIINRQQFNLKNNTTINKLSIIKNYIEENSK